MTVKLPIDPRTMPDGVVLILSVRFTADGSQRNPTIYQHAALKARGRWYLTGARAPHDAGWPAVEAWLRRDNRELVSIEIQTGTRTIWPEPVAMAVQDQDYADRLSTLPDGVDTSQS